MDLRKLGWGDVVQTGVPQGRDQWRALVNMVMNLSVPQNVGTVLNSCAIGAFSRRIPLHGVS
jgi:hypothetical protein